MLLLLIATAVNVAAKQFDNPKVIHQNSSTLNITGVVFTDSATIVSMRYTVTVDRQVSLRINSGVCLSDEYDNRYRLKHATGITTDTKEWTPGNSVRDFTLVFEPLPQNTKVFDLINGTPAQNTYRFIGIHDGDENVDMHCSNMPNPSADKPVPDLVYRKDSVIVHGTIKGYSPKWGVTTVSNYTNDLEDSQIHSHTTIGKDGSFMLKIAVDSPQWTSLFIGEFAHYQVDIFVFPGDELHLEINDILSEARSITYKSRNGHPTYNNLMRAVMLMPECFYNPTNHPNMTHSEFMEMAQTFRAKQLDGVDYLTKKFNLTPFECRLLANRAAMSYGTLMCFHLSGLESGERRIDASKYTCVEYDSRESRYTFLKDMPLDDELAIFDLSVFKDFVTRTSWLEMVRETHLVPTKSEPSSYRYVWDRLPKFRFGRIGTKDNRTPVVIQGQMVRVAELLKHSGYKEQIQSYADAITVPYLKSKFNEIIERPLDY